MNDLIRHLSPEDRRKLTAGFQTLQGSNQEDMRQRIVDGKYQWVKQAQILKEEERKKRITAVSKPVRALRDGENSLVALIYKTLTNYTVCADQYNRLEYINDLERMDCTNAYRKILSRTETYANELREVENKIELTKSQNPVIMDAEKLLLLISQLKQRGEESTVQQLQKQNAALLINYQNQRKSLAPLIDHARQLRADLQREYWRAMQAYWNLYESAIQKDFKTLTETSNTIEISANRNELKAEINEAKLQYDELVERENQLSLYLPSTMQQNNEGCQSWDEILPVMSSMLNEIEFMTEVLHSIMATIEPTAEAKSTKPSQRMVFTSSKNK